VGKLAGGAGALYRAGGEGAEAVGVGAGPVAIDGVGSSGGGNGEGKRKGRGEEGTREASRWLEVRGAAVLRPVAVAWHCRRRKKAPGGPSGLKWPGCSWAGARERERKKTGPGKAFGPKAKNKRMGFEI
jgi:hypothetical protein